MKLQSVAYVVGAFSVACMTGCQSPRDSRISEKRELFASLPPPVQAIIKDGMVDVGFTPDLVYLALGKPNRIQRGDPAQGQVSTWTYQNVVLSETAAAKLDMNNPGSRYQAGSMLSPNAPGGASISSTRNSGPQPSVSDMADARVGTLYVEFTNERVSGVRLER